MAARAETAYADAVWCEAFLTDESECAARVVKWCLRGGVGVWKSVNEDKGGEAEGRQPICDGDAFAADHELGIAAAAENENRAAVGGGGPGRKVEEPGSGDLSHYGMVVGVGECEGIGDGFGVPEREGIGCVQEGGWVGHLRGTGRVIRTGLFPYCGRVFKK